MRPNTNKVRLKTKSMLFISLACLFLSLQIACQRDSGITIPTPIPLTQVQGGNSKDDKVVEPNSGDAAKPATDGAQTPTAETPVVQTPAPTPETAPESATVVNSPVLTNGFYNLKGAASGRCVDVPNSSFTLGLKLQVYNCNTTDAQIFNLVLVKDNVYKITNRGNKLAMSVRGNTLATGAFIEQAAPVADAAQDFLIEPVEGTSNYLIKANGSPFAIEVLDPAAANGASLELAQKSGAVTQQWILNLLP